MYYQVIYSTHNTTILGKVQEDMGIHGGPIDLTLGCIGRFQTLAGIPQLNVLAPEVCAAILM